jgi:hypothetical protein
VIVSLVLAGAMAFARPGADSLGCDGRTVSSISINPQRPQFEGNAGKWRAVARALGLHHITTRPEVIRAYLLLSEGQPCTALRMSESERVLRALPFLADAKVTAQPDSTGGTAIEVETVDEPPVTATGSLRHSVPAAFGFGNENVGGLGLGVVAGIANNSPYRSAGFFRAADYAPFGAPTLVNTEIVRDALGSHFEVDAARLFLSNLQRGSWSASYRHGDDFPIIVRPNGDRQTVEVHEDRWSVGGVVRAMIGHNTALIGPVLLGNTLSPSTQSFIVANSGLAPLADSAIVNRFSASHSVRAGGLFGIRRVHFVTRTGLDALFAPQDVMLGWQLGTLAAPGIHTANGRDVLLAQSAYAGMASHRVAVLADFEGEARRDFTASDWASTIANIHGSAYFTPTSHFTLSAEDNYSMLGQSRLPTQLSLGDALGGPRGYAGSTIVGGRRNVIRTEARLATPDAVHHADVGVALFTDIASMWAGDVPFGVNATRQSVGFSLIAAYPTRAKRTYRLDFAFAVTGQRALQVRFISSNPTSAFGVEPNDVTQARLAPVPSSLFAWPGR